jgi:hypothetical protein
MLTLSSALLLSACGSVLVTQPMGENSVVLDPAAWEGTWASDELVMLTSVLDSKKGVLQAAWLERYEEGARFETVTGTVRQTGDWYFLSMKHEPAKTSEEAESTTSEEPPEYVWGRIENNGRRAVLWWPDLEQFRQAIREGRLPGRIKEDEDVVLGTLDAAQMEAINSPSGNLMNWTEPLVFVRIGD